VARHKHRRGSPLYVTPAFELFPKSYELIKNNFGTFAALYIFPLIIGLSNGTWVVDSRRSWHTDFPAGAAVLGNSTLPAYAYGGLGIALLIAMVIAIFLQIMTQAAQLEVSEGRKPKFGQLLQVARQRFWQMLGLYIWVGLITLVGFILFIVPGIIMLRRYFVAPYVLLENQKMGISYAMQKSADITKRDSWSVYSIMGVMVLFALFGALPLIGWIIAFGLRFFYSAAPALRYQELKKLS